MFEVGFTELLLISALALIVLGPQRLPGVASQVGRWVGRARAMARQFREQLDMEAQLESLSRPSSTPAPSPPLEPTPENPEPSPEIPEPTPEMNETSFAAETATPADSEHASCPTEFTHERGA